MAMIVRPHVMCATRSLLFIQTIRLSFHVSPSRFHGPLRSMQAGVIDASSNCGFRRGSCRPCQIMWGHSVLGRGYCRRRGMSTEANGNLNSQGSIDSSLMHSMEKKIKEQLDAETVIVEDAYGDGRHVSIYVVSPAFEGQSAVNRQRMVYKAIWEELQDTVHAVDRMITVTPNEATKK